MSHTDFDRLSQTYAGPYFEAIKDWRCSNSIYSLADSLSSVFALFSLKSSSLLDFEKRS